MLLDNTYMSLTADAALLISELGGLYRLSPDSPYEVGADVRYTDLRQDVHVGPLPGLHSDDTLTDGIAIGRATWPLNDRWRFALYADAGAGDSQFTWQSAATFFYSFDRGALGMGYRVLDYDIGGSHDSNIQLSSLTFGADFRF